MKEITYYGLVIIHIILIIGISFLIRKPLDLMGWEIAER